MRADRLEQAERDAAPRHEPGLGAPAGLYLLGGEYHVAALRTRAALRLAEQGALLVGALYFTAGEASLAADGGVRAAAGAFHPLRVPADLPALGGWSGRN